MIVPKSQLLYGNQDYEEWNVSLITIDTFYCCILNYLDILSKLSVNHLLKLSSLLCLSLWSI